MLQDAIDNSLKGRLLADDESDPVTINIPGHSLPTHFNLTGYAEVELTEPYPQTLTYYYSSTTFQFYGSNTQQSSISGFTIFILITLTVSSIVLVIVIYKRKEKQREKAKVAF